MSLGVIIAIGVAGIGFVISVVTSERGIGQMKRAFDAKRAGGIEAARAVIDKALTPKRPFPERFAALALIGDRDGLVRELAALPESPRTGYARAAGLFGLALLGDAQAPEQLANHAAAFERDAPRIFGRIKDNVKGIAAIGATLGGASSETLLKLRPGLYTMNQPWSTAMLWEACVRAFERDGKTQEASNARGHLAHLDRARNATS
jgi:hypothetical protein